MNDRLKFRAKRIDNNQFVIGYLCFIYVDDVKKGRIYSPQDCYSYDVDMTTLGQSTGLKDKNGTPIYEGDILQEGHTIGAVKWRNTAGSFMWLDILLDRLGSPFVIGNIYKNPELLEDE